MTQAWLAGGWPLGLSCAVPVLAAAWLPPASCRQQRAVPLLTTSIMSPRSVRAVSGSIPRRHTVGLVLVSTRPSRSMVWSTTCGVIISPPLATADATSAISSGVACVLPCPKPPMARSGMLPTKSATVPKTERAGRGRSNGGAWLNPHALGCGDHVRSPDVHGHLREGRVAAPAEDLHERPAARRAPVVLDRVGRLRREVGVDRRELGVERVLARSPGPPSPSPP